MQVRTLLLAALAAAAALPAQGAEGVWQAMSEPGHAILVRHANAPGTGDPAAFTLGDCSAQRNLDRRGREQARHLGERLRDGGVDGRAVYTSRWCRCRDTATLLGVGPVEPHDGLNSFYGDRFTEAAVMPRLRAFLRDSPLNPPPVLVTHQVNITALTGVFPREGEVIVIAVDGAGTVEVVGRIPPDD